MASRTQADGRPLIRHLEALRAQSGIVHPLLAEAEEPIPEGAEHIWGWFNELAARRPPAMVGRAPLSYSEIDAWRRLTKRTVLPCEVQAIMALDDVLLAVLAEKTDG